MVSWKMNAIHSASMIMTDAACDSTFYTWLQRWQLWSSDQFTRRPQFPAEISCIHISFLPH